MHLTACWWSAWLKGLFISHAILFKNHKFLGNWKVWMYLVQTSVLRKITDVRPECSGFSLLPRTRAPVRVGLFSLNDLQNQAGWCSRCVSSTPDVVISASRRWSQPLPGGRGDPAQPGQQQLLVPVGLGGQIQPPRKGAACSPCRPYSPYSLCLALLSPHLASFFTPPKKPTLGELIREKQIIWLFFFFCCAATGNLFFPAFLFLNNIPSYYPPTYPLLIISVKQQKAVMG